MIAIESHTATPAGPGSEPHLPTLFDAIAAARPDQVAIRTRHDDTTWGQLARRTDALASVLVEAGVTVTSTGTDAAPWECPNPRVALYLHNHPAYLEAMVSAWKARATAMNVNYRYRATELRDLLDDGQPEAVIYHQTFSSILAEVLPRLKRRPRLLICVPDGSGHALLPATPASADAPAFPAAVDYEAALAGAGILPEHVRAGWSPGDRYVVFTGGTTGTPKGVLWRQSDFAVSALGFDASAVDRAGGLAAWAAALPEPGPATLPAPPFMHGAAHWNALAAWLKGGTVVLPEYPDRFDADAVLDAVEWGEASALIIVGDAFARPLLEADDRRPRKLTGLRHLLTGGAILSPSVKAALAERWPHVTIVDVLGSSESGRQAVHRHRAVTAVHRHRAAPAEQSDTDQGDTSHSDTGQGDAEPTARMFRPDADTVIVTDAVDAIVAPPAPGEHSQVGWLARSGRVPLGYLGHPERTRQTFPVLRGKRLAVTGDRARYSADAKADVDATIELLGRESACINTGGEKVFAEEVEERLAHHPAVADLVVAPAEDERFGQAVGAVAALHPGETLTLDALRAFGRTYLSDYKLPRYLVLVDEVVRSPSGKPDYPWAQAQLAP